MVKALVLLSGGLDSAVALFLTKKNQKYEEIYAITFTYGSKEEKTSIKSAKILTEKAKVKDHLIINLPWLGKFGEKIGSTLKHGQKSVPKLNENQLEEVSLTKISAKSVWIPARNLCFLSIATSYAETLRGDIDLITGFNKEEAETFPDNSKGFIESFNRALEKAVIKAKVKVVAPLIDKNKEDICKIGIDELKAPIEYSTSCYEPQGFNESNKPIHCGVCESCQRRKRGFKKAEVEDPTIYIQK